MTNSQKFKTADERARAFKEWCHKQDVECNKCRLFSRSEMSRCRFAWLDLEAEEDILPCPFCGEECTATVMKNEWRVSCIISGCYRSSFFGTEAEAIAAHNRVARAVMEAKKKGARNEGT